MQILKDGAVNIPRQEKIFEKKIVTTTDVDSEQAEVVGDEVFDNLASSHPKIEYSFEPPGAKFKREMVEKYMKAAPFMY